jgi:O-antigen/teichoic acid export membrane protein
LSSPTLGDPTAEPITTEAQPPGVVANSAWMLFAQGFATLIGGGVSIYAVRHFAPATWGHYSTALALVALFTIVSGSGLAPLVLRELAAAAGPRQAEILGGSLQALLWMSAAALVGLITAAAVLGYPRDVLVLVLVLSPAVLLDPALAIFAAAFNARSRLFFVALFQLVQAVVFGTVAIVAITSAFGVAGLAAAMITGSVVAATLAIFLLRSKLGLNIRLRQPPRRAWSFLRAAIPIAGINLVAIVYDRVDIVMLSVLSNSSTVAFYAVPYSLVKLSWLLPSVISAAFFPLLSRTLETDRAQAEYLFFLVVRVFFFVSLPISLLLAVSSPTLLPSVFGHSYFHSVPALQIMAWTSVLGFQNYIFWYALLAARKERAVFYIQIGGLGMNVAINAFAIPLYGSSGAAAALLVSDLVVIAGQVILVHRHLFAIRFADLLAKPAAVGVVAVAVATLIATRTPVGGAVVGAVSYVVVLLALRYVTLEEWRPVTAILKGPFRLLGRSAP